MFDSLGQFGAAFWGFMSPGVLFTVLWATFLGIVIGALPGLTATMGVALMTTLTFTMPHTQAILVLVCIYVGAIYGGSRSAILLNIPGTPASACSTLDGYPAGAPGPGRAAPWASPPRARGSARCLARCAWPRFTPVLSEMALKFQSFEFFWIALFGIVIAGTLAGGDALKGYLAGFLGLWIATIGQEPYYNYQRFAFGSTDLAGGIGLLPALVGAFGVAEVLQAMRGPAVKAISSTIDSVIPRIADVLQHWRTILRSGAIGTFIGILPGLGEDTAAWSSYAAARRASKEKEKYGKGSIEGLMSAETGESACVPGAIIPVLTLAVPGSAPAAVLMAAMMIHDLNPGPNLMLQTPEFFYQIVAMLVIADMSKLLFGLDAGAAAAVDPARAARAADAGRVRAVRGRRLRHHLARVRHLRHAVLRLRRLRPARAQVPDGADDPGAGAGRSAGEEPDARAGAVGRQRRPVLHAARVRGPLRHHHPVDPVVDPGRQPVGCATRSPPGGASIGGKRRWRLTGLGPISQDG